MWESVSDNYRLTAGEKLRVRIVMTGINLGLSESESRRIIEKNSSLNVLQFDRTLAGYGPFHDDVWIVATVADNVPVGFVRADVETAINEIRSTWSVTAITAEVTDIEVWRPSIADAIIPDIPTTTTLSLISIAILAVVGFLVYRSLV